LVFGSLDVNAQCVSKDCKKLESFIFDIENKNSIFFKSKIDKSIKKLSSIKTLQYSIFEEDFRNLNDILFTVLASNNQDPKINNEEYSYEIESDSQYFDEEVFYAEGNVKVFLKNGILEADKISYDKSKKLFKAYNRISFNKGDQFFKADYLEYNFTANKGHIKNIYGILDFSTINKDLKLYDNNSLNKTCQKRDIDLNELPTEVDLLSSTNERYKNAVGLNKIKFNFSDISNWRFKTKKIELSDNKWRTDLITFTNDPFNKPQLMIKSKNFVGELINNQTKFTSSSSSISLDDRITIPIIGKRTISNTEQGNLRWGIGYESDNKDGFYILRNFDPIELNNYFSLDLQPYFLFQRAIEGNSNAFRDRDTSVLSNNIKKNINIYDYFGLNAKLNGEIDRWKIIINADSKTFNKDNFYDSFSGDLNLVRNIYRTNNRKINNLNKYCNKLKSENNLKSFSLDIGGYSSFDKDDVYFSYGTKLLSNYRYSNEDFSKDYSLVIDYGHFKGRGLTNNYELLSMSRYGISSSLSNIYRVRKTKNILTDYSDSFDKTPKPIDNGLFINAKLSSGIFEYSNGKSQSIISFLVGPSYTYGKLKNNFLDYTKISIFPELLIKKGESPFKFDDFNNDSRIKFDFRQQLYGPFILGFEADYNINTDTSNYGKFENKTISIEISRRAYSLALSYQEDDRSIFLGFEIFNFGRTNFNQEF